MYCSSKMPGTGREALDFPRSQCTRRACHWQKPCQDAGRTWSIQFWPRCAVEAPKHVGAVGMPVARDLERIATCRTRPTH